MAKARSTRKPRRSAPARRTKGRKARSKARRVGRSADDQSGWPYSQFAVWSQRLGDPTDDRQTNPTIVLLRHPAAPYTGTANLRSFAHDLQKLGHAYLTTANNNRRIEPRLEIPREWLDALDPDGGGPAPDLFPSFGWLPIEWPATGPAFRSLVSFRALRMNARQPSPPRRAPRSEPPRDQIVVLLASQKRGPGEGDPVLGSEFGIRIVAHVRESQSGLEVLISGMTASLPFGIFRPARLPKSLIRTGRRRARDAAFAPRMLVDFLTSPERDFRNTIAQMHGLDSRSVAIQGLRLSPIFPSSQGFQAYAELNVSGQTKNTNAGVATSVEPYFSFVFATNLATTDSDIGSSELTLVRKTELVAEARAFPIDPSSQEEATEPIHKRRPTRREDVLDTYRLPEPTPTVLQYAPAAGYVDDTVIMCPGFVFDDDGLSGTKTVSPGDAPVRSNNASAIMAYWNVEQLFDRLSAYGIDPNSYFRICPLPIEIHYRSGIRPGPGKDGQTVNAQVRVKGFPDNFEGPIPPNQDPTIEMHLALADLSTRARKPYAGTNRSPAEPLGIAADARWIWHEIGHVLLTTSVGELQFRFAHSPGDALAAIVSDPESKLAKDRNWRGSTFPWVFLPRRHDRSVTLGWSWGGTMHYALSQVPTSVGPRRKAYWSEQILSSSLFRLYRSIGGDTVVLGPSGDPDPHARRSASHYCVYLIMRGIQILGTSLVSPTNDPDQFASALIDADISTASSTPSWHVVFPPVFPPGPPDTFDRIGGCVNKVIRWAFEAQGLYNLFGKITNAPGTPPLVDIYIDDLRPSSETTIYGNIDYGRGSYNPVSLEWDQNQSPTDVPPKWQADPAAIAVAANGKISVVVRNRGTKQAQKVTVSVWWHDWPWPAGVTPEWDAAAWTPCPPATSAAQSILPGGYATFGPFAAVPLPAGGRYVLLAQATCADDRANIDTATNYPCSQKPTLLVDLVPNDNNLGLRVLVK